MRRLKAAMTPRQMSRAGAVVRWAPTLAILAIGVAISFAAFDIAQRLDDTHVRGVLELRAEWRVQDFERKLGAIAEDAEAMAVYVAVERNAAIDNIRRLAHLLHDPKDSNSALIWAPLVKAEDRDAFVATARKELGADFNIGERSPDGRFIAASPRAEYLPLLVEMNYDGDPAPSGFDLMSLPERRIRIERARDEGRPIATPAVSVFSASGPALGFLAFWPVYDTDDVPATVEARRSAFRGMAVARYRFDRLLPGLIGNTPPLFERIDILIDGGRDAPAAQHVATFDPTTGKFVVGSDAAPPEQGEVTLDREFDVLGRHWTMLFHFPSAFVAAQRPVTPWAWLVFGFLLTGLLAAYVERERSRRRATEGIVSDRTRDLTAANTSLNREIEVRRQTETTLRESEERFRRIFDESPMGIVLATPDDSRIVQANRAFAVMLGYEPAELVGRAIDDLLHPDELRVAAAQATHAARQWRNFERRYVTKSGKTAWARVGATLLAGSDGRPSLALGITEDITQRRLTEQQLVQAQKMEAIGNLTGGMAHDFNNLLGIIVGNLDLAQPYLKAVPEVDEFVNEALDAALRGAELTRSLLAFARQQPLQPMRVEINNLVAGMVKLLGRTLGENIEISLDLAADTWPVVADPAQLEASIANLATNARDAMPKGGRLMIATGNRRLDDDYAASHPDVIPGDYATIEVSDTGTGMTSDILERVFEPFFTTKDRDKGTGLGLSMIFGFMKQSGGHINI